MSENESHKVTQIQPGGNATSRRRQQKSETMVKPDVGPSWSDQAQDCVRCKAVTDLENMGFTAADALIALGQVTPPNDIIAATNWLLEHPRGVTCSDRSPGLTIGNTGTRQIAKPSRERSQTSQITLPSQSLLRKKDINTSPWITVEYKGTESASNPALVVGSEIAAPLNPIKDVRTANFRRRERRRARLDKKSDIRECVSDSNIAILQETACMGSIELSGGRIFTWIIDADQTKGRGELCNAEYLTRCDMAAIEQAIFREQNGEQ